MNASKLISITLLFLLAHSAYSDDFAKYLENHPLLSYENCENFHPFDIIDFLEKKSESDSNLLPIQGLLGQDIMIQVYGQKLCSVVDKKYPNAKNIREPLCLAKRNLVELHSLAHGGGTADGHAMARTCSILEYTMLQGVKTDFTLEDNKTTSITYSAEDIKKYGEILFKYKLADNERLNEPGMDRKKQAHDEFDQMINNLKKAELSMNDKEKKYYLFPILKDLMLNFD